METYTRTPMMAAWFAWAVDRITLPELVQRVNLLRLLQGEPPWTPTELALRADALRRCWR